jgi:5S rRNA maturation endonuclease (ribonuclease M5)
MTGEIECIYDYTNASGVLLFQVVRMKPKGFRQRRPDGKGGWIWNLDGTTRPLYNLPLLINAKRGREVFFVEGEKDADNLIKLGLLATTTSGGANGWKSTTSMYSLESRAVFIIADKDEPGRRFAREIAEYLEPMTVSVFVMEMPDVGDIGVKDVSDWIDAQDSRDNESLAAEITKMAWDGFVSQPKPLKKAGAGQSATSALPGPAAQPPPELLPDMICLKDVKAESLHWLWPGRLPMGKVSLLFGDPGLGKSLVSISIASLVSNGADWPDGSKNKKGGVILLSAEDDLSDTIRPRFDAAGGDVGAITVLRGVKERDDSGTLYFNMSRDMPMLAEAIKQTPDCRLVIIDPISAYLGGTDTHVNAEVRALLAPLSTLAADSRIALLTVTHLNKSAGTRALYRAMGSLAFIASARAAWLITPDPDDAGRRFMLPAKLNLAEWPSGLAYRIGQTVFDDIGPVARIEWEHEPILISADDALASGDVRGTHHAKERQEAVDWLKKELESGELSAIDVQVRAMEAGISVRHLNAAKRDLGVRVTKAGFAGGWRWTLPNAGTPPPGRYNTAVT